MGGNSPFPSITGWWFRIFFKFYTFSWGKMDPIWRRSYFFKWVGWNHQLDWTKNPRLLRIPGRARELGPKVPATVRELPELGTLATEMMAPEMPPDRVPWFLWSLLLGRGGGQAKGQGYLEVGPLPNGRTSWLITGFFLKLYLLTGMIL